MPSSLHPDIPRTLQLIASKQQRFEAVTVRERVLAFFSTV
jgi:hypothetical protein